MKKLLVISLLSFVAISSYAQEELSPAEREMVEVAKERIKELREKKASERLRARMQSESEGGVTVEEAPKKPAKK